MKHKAALACILVMGVFLVACGREQFFGPTPTPAPTNTSMPTFTLYPTNTPYPTYTLYPTFTTYPTFTLIPTLIATPTLKPNLRCIDYPAGLISWWPADGNAKDIQYINEGTMGQGATFADGMVGQAFSFDGASRVSAPTNDLPIGGSDRTLDLWVRVNSFFDGQAFFAGYGSFGSLDQTYHLGTTGNTLFFSQWGQAIFGPALQAGRWYHVAVTNVGSAVTLYLDGEAVASGDMHIDTPRGTQLFIGSLPTEPSMRTNGLIDEVDVYTRALSIQEIRSIYSAGNMGKCKVLLHESPTQTPTPPPDEAAGLVLHFDGSFYGAGNEQGYPSDGLSFVAGHTGQAVLFNRENTLYYLTGNNISPQQGAIEFWLKPLWNGNDNQNYTFFEIGDSWFNRFRITKDGANNFRFMVWSSKVENGVACGVSNWMANEWHQVKVTWQNDSIALYLDGDICGTQSFVVMPEKLSSRLYIGSSAHGDSQAQSVMDEFTIRPQP